MGIRLEPENFDQMYRSLTKEPKIVNDIVEASEKDKSALNRLIYTTYSGDLLSNLPTCECGHLEGGYNTGVACPKCGSEVQLHVEREIEPIAWIRAPHGVAALINPIIWMMLRKRFTRSGFEVIRWLCDTDYSPKINIPPAMKEVEALGLERGLNNFVTHFDEYMTKLMGLRSFRVRSALGDPLELLIRQYRDRIFSQWIPAPNRTLLVVEESNLGKFVDPVIPIAVNAIRIMAGIDASLKPLSVRTKENRTVKAIVLLADFYEKYYKEVMAKKEGVFRKHAFGTRNHWSFRAVISSITRAHSPKELHIPWGIGVSVFKVHLTSKLKRRGYGPNAAEALLATYAQSYSPLLDELFQELISECPYMGIPCTIVRHPSLGRGSIQQLFITRVKGMFNEPHEVEVPTIGLPITIVRSMNADFDGDQISVILTLDVDTTEKLSLLQPHYNTYSMSAPRKISGNPAIPKPVVATIANALHAHHPVDPAKLARMKAAFNLQ